MKWAAFFLLGLPACAPAERLRASRSASDSANAETSSSIDEEAPRELQEDNTIYDVCIVGAGWAGVGAAWQLIKMGKTNIKVLEGTNYTGGRAKTVILDGGVDSTELGANWVYGPGAYSSYLSDIVEDSGVAWNSVPYGNAEITHTWTDVWGLPAPGASYEIPPDVIGPLSISLYDRFVQFQNPIQNKEPDQSMLQLFERFIQEKNMSNDDVFALNSYLDSVVEAEYAADLKNISIKYWEVYGPIQKGYAMLSQKVKDNKIQGYTGVMNSFVAPFLNKITFNANVTAINYTNSVSSVSYIHNGVPKTCKAKHVLVTVSLGCLKANTISFTPALNTTKVASIKNMGMALLNKVIMHFDENAVFPWNKAGGNAWVEKLTTREKQGHWTNFLDLRRYTNTTVFVAWMYGDFARDVENLSDDTIKAQVMASLESMFGGSTVPVPKEWFITRWGQNPWTRGAYSYYPVGATPTDRENVKSSVNKKLHFAGEHTSAKYYGTVRGAVEEGILTAEIVSWLLDRK